MYDVEGRSTLKEEKILTYGGFGIGLPKAINHVLLFAI